MPEKKLRNIVPGEGWFHDLSLRVHLILRLMADSRVPIWLKMLPLGSLVYLLVPDLMPGPIDDAVIVWLGAYLFVELCPQHVVQEHLEELTQGVISGKWRDIKPEDIMEGEFREKK